MNEEIIEDTSRGELLRMTAKVVAAYVSNNMIPASQISEVIKAVHSSLSGVGAASAKQKSEPLTPAVPIRRSVTPDYIVCLEDGKKLKMLKGHLRTSFDMTPDEYRAKWALPSGYPMVAPNYAAQRSAFAKKIGLGRTAGRKRRGRRRANA